MDGESRNAVRTAQPKQKNVVEIMLCRVYNMNRGFAYINKQTEKSEGEKMTELEKMQRAKEYVDKLANGIDPLTDMEMPDDKVLNNVRISRCLFYVSEILGKVIENGGEVERKKVKKQPFSISNEQLGRIKISEEPVGVSIIAERIAEVLDEGVRKVPATHITSWLVSEGYLIENTYADKKRKVATAKGESIGIITVDGESFNGVAYKKNVYNADAQRFVISNLAEIEG